ncbi:hypothetical protein HaLaN_28881, partial [Haematococcus lacustris]
MANSNSEVALDTSPRPASYRSWQDSCTTRTINVPSASQSRYNNQSGDCKTRFCTRQEAYNNAHSLSNVLVLAKLGTYSCEANLPREHTLWHLDTLGTNPCVRQWEHTQSHIAKLGTYPSEANLPREHTLWHLDTMGTHPCVWQWEYTQSHNAQLGTYPCDADMPREHTRDVQHNTTDIEHRPTHAGLLPCTRYPYAHTNKPEDEQPWDELSTLPGPAKYTPHADPLPCTRYPHAHTNGAEDGQPCEQLHGRPIPHGPPILDLYVDVLPLDMNKMVGGKAYLIHITIALFSMLGLHLRTPPQRAQ